MNLIIIILVSAATSMIVTRISAEYCSKLIEDYTKDSMELTKEFMRNVLKIVQKHIEEKGEKNERN